MEKNIKQKGKSFVVLFFAILSAIYLIPEIIFNATLVSVVSNTTSENELESVEIFGRAVSGVGLSLLVAGFFAAKSPLNKISSVLVIMVMSFLVCWPTMYYGQKWLVDKLVDNASPEQRRDSYLSYGIKHALRNGTLKINNIPYSGKKGDFYDDTFLILIGGMIFYNEDVIKFFGSKKEEILTAYINSDANQEFIDHYNSYKQNRAVFRSKFKDYQLGSQKYNNELATVPKYQHSYWEKFNNEMYQSYDKYMAYRNAFNGRVEARATKIAPIVFNSIKTSSNCWNRYGGTVEGRNCSNRVKAKYRKDVAKYGFSHVKRSYWLSSKKTVSNSVQFYSPKIRKLMLPGFKKETGYDYSVNNYAKFKAAPATARKGRASLGKRYGLKLPKSWKASHKKSFYTAVRNRAKEKALAKWNKELAKHGLDIPPNLSWSKFQNHKSVQKLVAGRMGANYVSPTLFDWNDEGFKKNVFSPLMKRKVDDAIAKINASLPEFKEGGSLYEDSRASLKAILVPPISMTISLFLIIFTIFGLCKKVVYLLSRPIAGKLKSESAEFTEVKGDDGEVKTVVVIKEKSHAILKYASPIATAVFAWVLLVGPILFLKTDSQRDNGALNYILKDIPVAMSYSINWALITQPLFQELGHKLSNEVKVYDVFKNYEKNHNIDLTLL